MRADVTRVDNKALFLNYHVQETARHTNDWPPVESNHGCAPPSGRAKQFHAWPLFLSVLSMPVRQRGAIAKRGALHFRPSCVYGQAHSE